MDPTKGDDFDANLNTNNPGRKFFTVLGADSAGLIRSKRSIRPSLTVDDGLGLYGGTVTGLQDASRLPQRSVQSPQLSRFPRLPFPSNAKQLLARARRQAIVPTSRCNGKQVCPVFLSLAPVRHSKHLPCDSGLGGLAKRISARRIIRCIRRGYGHSKAAPHDVCGHDRRTAPRIQSGVERFNRPSSGRCITQQRTLVVFPPHVLPGILPNYGRQSLLLDGSLVTKDVVSNARVRKLKVEQRASIGDPSSSVPAE